MLREAGEHGLVGRREQGARPRRARAPRSARARRTTSGSSPRRWSPGREIEVGGARRRSAGGVAAGRGRARRRVLRLRRQVRGRARRSCSRPRRSTTPQTAEVRALAVRAFEACRCEAMARVDFFLTTTDGLRRERAEHDPRVHADLDVPEAVGGVRAAVLRAARPAHRPRDRTPRTPRPPGGRQR